MSFRERVPLGRTGRMVTRLGLASGYGVPAAAMEKAFHEHGINYFYVSPFLNLGSMVEAVRNLGPGNRGDLFLVLARPLFRGLRLEHYVERWLKKFRLDWIDLLFQDLRKAPGPALTDQIKRLQENGKVRFLGMSSHNRALLGKIGSGEVDAPVDFFHLRYNAVHTGAEEEIFPHLRREDRPGTVVFTATCWRKLVKPKLMPEGEAPLTAAECYRFVLSRTEVDVCITAPSTAERLAENLTVLNDGPLDGDDMARIRRIGRHIYEN